MTHESCMKPHKKSVRARICAIRKRPSESGTQPTHLHVCGIHSFFFYYGEGREDWTISRVYGNNPLTCQQERG